MSPLNAIIILSIDNLITVNLRKGYKFEMVNRKTYGISFAEKGKISYIHNGISYVSDSGHAVILPKGQSYSLECETTGSFPVINFICTDFETEKFIVIPIHNTPNYIQQYAEMKRLTLNKHSNAKCMSIFYSLFSHICEDSLLINNQLYPAIQYIEKHYSEPITNETLARKLNISEVYLRKLFKKNYNISPKQYILNYRLLRAKQCLSDSTKSVSDICFSSGFTNIYHFSRIFKEKIGMTPSEYRKTNNNYEL